MEEYDLIEGSTFKKAMDQSDYQFRMDFAKNVE